MVPVNAVRYAIPVVRAIISMAAIGCCVFLLSHFRLSHYFPIHTVRVYGIHHIDQQEAKNALMPLVNHGFFGINIEAIRDRMLQLPWAEDIFVRREWPSRVNVTVREKQVIAYWNDDILLSDKGELFQPALSTLTESVPHFYGPAGKHQLVLQYYHDMDRILKPLHARITMLEMTPYLTWKLTLDNGLNLQAGQKDTLERLAHLVRVYPSIVGERAGDVEYIDLRYSNGVAVRWKHIVKT